MDAGAGWVEALEYGGAVCRGGGGSEGEAVVVGCQWVGDTGGEQSRVTQVWQGGKGGGSERSEAIGEVFCDCSWMGVEV